jgi:hypothetical protein
VCSGFEKSCVVVGEKELDAELVNGGDTAKNGMALHETGEVVDEDEEKDAAEGVALEDASEDFDGGGELAINFDSSSTPCVQGLDESDEAGREASARELQPEGRMSKLIKGLHNIDENWGDPGVMLGGGGSWARRSLFKDSIEEGYQLLLGVLLEAETCLAGVCRWQRREEVIEPTSENEAEDFMEGFDGGDLPVAVEAGAHSCRTRLRGLGQEGHEGVGEACRHQARHQHLIEKESEGGA